MPILCPTCLGHLMRWYGALHRVTNISPPLFEITYGANRMLFDELLFSAMGLRWSSAVGLD